MYYRGRGPWRGNRRRGGIFGIPWMLFFLFFVFSHSFIGFLIGLAVAIVLTVILTRVFSANSYNGMNSQQPGQTYYQPSNQAQQQPYYQPTEQTYQGYDQGYQVPIERREGPQGSGGQYQTPPVPDEPYRGEYEQPQTQYPEQMPPMQ